MKEYISHSTSETLQIAETLTQSLGQSPIIGLTGSIGAGKTTFVKGIALSLGIREEVTSPTFTIIAEYSGKIPLYHIDLYRISSIEEFEFLGVEDYLPSDGITAIEWCEKITDVLPSETIIIRFSLMKPPVRKICIHTKNEDLI